MDPAALLLLLLFGKPKQTRYEQPNRLAFRVRGDKAAAAALERLEHWGNVVDWTSDGKKLKVKWTQIWFGAQPFDVEELDELPGVELTSVKAGEVRAT